MLPTSVHSFSTFKSNEPWTPYKLQYTCLFPIIFTFLCRILFWLNLYLLKKPLYFMIKEDVQKNLIIQSILATNQVIEKNYHCPKNFYCCSNCFEECSNNVVGNFQPHLVAFSYRTRWPKILWPIFLGNARKHFNRLLKLSIRQMDMPKNKLLGF
jgi:hypothetical protein